MYHEFKYNRLVAFTGMQKKEINNFLLSSLGFQNVDRFILIDFGRHIRLSYLEFVSITMVQKKSLKVQKKYVTCGQKFRGPSQLGCRVLNKRAQSESQNLTLSSIRSEAEFDLFSAMPQPVFEMEYVLQDDFSLDELYST